MNPRKKSAIWVGVLCTAFSLLVWHMASWYSNGMHMQMFQWPDSGRGLLTALYNLAVMLAAGIMLGVLMDRIGNLFKRGGDR